MWFHSGRLLHHFSASSLRSVLEHLGLCVCQGCLGLHNSGASAILGKVVLFLAFVLFVPYNISSRAAVFLKVNSVQGCLHMGETGRFMYDEFWFGFQSIRMCVGQNLWRVEV